MIIDFIVGSLVGLLTSVLTAILPTDPPPVEAIGGLTHGYAWFNTWLPVSESLNALVVTVEVMVVLGTVYAVFWALRQIPFLGLGGR